LQSNYSILKNVDVLSHAFLSLIDGFNLEAAKVVHEERIKNMLTSEIRMLSLDNAYDYDIF